VSGVDPASSPPTPPDAVRVPIGNPEGVAVSPGHPAPGHDVDQRVRLIPVDVTRLQRVADVMHQSLGFPRFSVKPMLA
jgi:hypothetical protein